MSYVFIFSAGTAQASSLEQAVMAALDKHPTVEAAIASLNSAKQQRREQFSNFFPEVSLGASGGRQFADNSTSRGLVTTRGEAYSYFGEGTINVRQRLFDGLETFNRLDAATAREDSAFNSVFEVRENLALRAAQTYINVLRARKGVEMIKGHRGKVIDYLARIRNMVDEGAADETEVQQALDIQVILDGILADFEGQLMAAESQFVEVTGMTPPAHLAEPVSVLQHIPQNINEGVEYALNNHPSIAVAKDNSEAASHEIDAEKGTLFPDLNTELSYLKNDRKDEIGGETEDARATLRMNWNFSTGGAQLARIKRSKYAHQEAMANLRDAQRRIERDARLAYSEYTTSSRQLELLGKRRELNEKLFETFTAQFEGARVNLLQLMQSDNQRFNTILEGMNGKYRKISAEYAVLASIGMLQSALNLEGLAFETDAQAFMPAQAEIVKASAAESMEPNDEMSVSKEKIFDAIRVEKPLELPVPAEITQLEPAAGDIAEPQNNREVSYTPPPYDPAFDAMLYGGNDFLQPAPVKTLKPARVLKISREW